MEHCDHVDGTMFDRDAPYRVGVTRERTGP